MSLLQQHEKAFADKPKSLDTQMLLASLNNSFTELNGETSSRISRYRTYNNFFNGNQWYRLNRKQNRHSYTVNLCEPTVIKYASLLMGDAPTVRVPLQSDVNPEHDINAVNNFDGKIPDFNFDENRSEVIEKVLSKMLFIDNPGARILYEAAKGGSEYGDTVLYMDFDEKKKTFKFQNVFPGYVRAAFATDDYCEVDYVVLQNVVTPGYIKRKFDIEVEPDLTGDIVGTDLVWNSRKYTENKYVLLMTYYDEDVKVVYTHDKILYREKHGLPRVPFFFIPNRVDPFNPWGISDLRDIIQIQEQLNVAVSNQSDIIELFANPKIIGRNLTQRDMEAISSNAGNVIPLRRDADLQPFQFTSQIYPVQQEITRVMQSFHDVSGLPPVFFGTAQGSIVTGVALTAQAAPTLQIVNAKALVWQDALKAMFGFMLQVLEKKGGTITIKNAKIKYSDLIDGDYNVDLQMNIRTPKDDSIYINNEINKKNMGIQATTTTMANLGIKSPDNEMMKIMWEKVHPLFTPNPELLLEQQIRTPSGTDEMVNAAFQDVERMSSGEQVPGNAASYDEAQIKLEVASQFVKTNDGLDPAVMAAFDSYMADLEQFMNKQQGNIKKLPQAQKSPGSTSFPTPPQEIANQVSNPTLPEGANTPQAPLPVQSGGMPGGL